MHKVTLESVARWKVGDTAYVLDLGPYPHCGRPPGWPNEVYHPADDRDWRRPNWWGRSAKPRVPSLAFTRIVSLIGAELAIKAFSVAGVRKSRETGGMFYVDSGDEWLPETCLFDTEIAARKECDRIRGMVVRWAEGRI